MKYVTVYDVLEYGYGYWWAPIGTIMGICVLLLLLILRNTKKRAMISNGVLAVVSILPLGLGFVTAVSWSDYWKLASALRAERCAVVEGKITEFSPMPKEEHAVESFIVAGVRFEYGESEMVAGFHSTHLSHGPIEEGLYVRIHSYSGKIARLEVRKQ